MADFYQTGVVTTLHRLGHARVDQLERDLERFTVAEPRGAGAAVPDRRTGPAGPRAHRRSPAPGAVPRHGGGQPREGDAGGPGPGPGPVRPVPPARPDHLARRAARRQGARPPARRRAPAHRRGEGLRVLDRLRPGPRRGAMPRAGRARLRHHDLRPRAAGQAVLPGGASVAGVRVRKGLLRAGDRPHERPRDAPVHDAAPAVAAGRRRAATRCWSTSTASATRWPASSR